MLRSFESRSGRRILFVAIIFAIAAVVFMLPRTRSEAAKGLVSRTESHEDALPNFDIRIEKNAGEKLAHFRSTAGRQAFEIADARDAMVRGEESLKQRVPTLKVEYNTDLKIPELIAPDVKQGKAFLTRASGLKRSEILKGFLNENTELVGARTEQIKDLKVFSDYTNPDGKLSFVELDQEVNGVPVFRGEIKAGFTTDGKIIRVINNFAPGLDDASLSTDFGDPAEAVRIAAESINSRIANAPLKQNDKTSTDLKVVFGIDDFYPRAERRYFTTEPGIPVQAGRVLI